MLSTTLRLAWNHCRANWLTGSVWDSTNLWVNPADWFFIVLLEWTPVKCTGPVEGHYIHGKLASIHQTSCVGSGGRSHLLGLILKAELPVEFSERLIQLLQPKNLSATNLLRVFAMVCRIVVLLCSVCVHSEAHLLHFNALTMLIALICYTLSSITELSSWSSSQPVFHFILLYLISSTLLIAFCPCHRRTQRAGRYWDTWWKQRFPVRSF